MVRAWFGLADGVGSMKTVVSIENDAYHGHFEIPETPPEGSEVWIEIELEDGTTVSDSAPRS